MGRFFPTCLPLVSPSWIRACRRHGFNETRKEFPIYAEISPWRRRALSRIQRKQLIRVERVAIDRRRISLWGGICWESPMRREWFAKLKCSPDPDLVIWRFVRISRAYAPGDYPEELSLCNSQTSMERMEIRTYGERNHVYDDGVTFYPNDNEIFQFVLFLVIDFRILTLIGLPNVTKYQIMTSLNGRWIKERKTLNE